MAQGLLLFARLCFLVFLWQHGGIAGHQVGCLAVQLYAAVACATLLDTLEKHVGLVLQAKGAADGQVVEGEVLLLLVAGVVAMQDGFELFARRAVERYLLGVALQGCQALGREMAAFGIVPQEVAVVVLPFVAVGRYVGAVLLVGEQMRLLVQQHHEKHVGVEAAVDADGMACAATLRPTVVAQLAFAVARDVQIHAVRIHKGKHLFYDMGVQVARQSLPVLLCDGFVHDE